MKQELEHCFEENSSFRSTVTNKYKWSEIFGPYNSYHEAMETEEGIEYNEDTQEMDIE